MRNLFCLAALAAGLGQVQVSTPAALRDQAVASLVAGKTDKAREAARACVAAGDPACLLIEGRAAFNAGDFDEAAKALSAARPTLSDLDAHLAKLLGEALLLGGHPQDAAVNLREAQTKDPTGPAGLRAAALLADALLDSGDPRGAIARRSRACSRYASIAAGTPASASSSLPAEE